MFRVIEKWEEKYIKFILSRSFKIFKWNIYINVNVINRKLEKEWAKRAEKAIEEALTLSDTNNIKWYVEA